MKRAGLRALFAFLVTTALGIGAFALLARPESNSRQFGEGVGQLAVYAAAAAFIASWMGQTGRRKIAIGIVAGFSTLAVVLFVALAVVDHHQFEAAAPITDAERAPLLAVDEAGERRLRHPAFGFSILHPGTGFKESAEVASAMAIRGDDSTQVYGFLEAETRSALIVSVMKGMGGSKSKLASHVDGVLSGLQHSVAGKAEFRMIAKEVVWDERAHVGRFSAVVGEATGVELAAYSVRRPGQQPFIVNLMITAPEVKRFAALLASLRY